MKKPIITLFLIVLLVGCKSRYASSISTVPANVTYITTELTSTDTPTATSTTHPTPTRPISMPTKPIPTYTTTITPTLTPVQEIISPTVVTICPEQQVVSFESLELPKELRLLLLPGSVDDYPQIPGEPLILSLGNLTPQPILDDKLLSYDVSPDHKWISFERTGDDGKSTMLWISSLDGKKQWPVMRLGDKGHIGYPAWVSENKIFLIGSPNAIDYDELDIWTNFPFLNINPFTLEQRPLTYLAGDQSLGIFYYGSFSSKGQLYTLYGHLNRVDFLYDFNQEKVLHMFQWLNEVDLIGQVIAPVWIYDEDKFAVTVERSDGLDLAMGLDIQSATDKRRYSDVMKRILLPERLLPFAVLGIIPGSNQIALRRMNSKNFESGPYWFYTIDYQSKETIDYCFDLSRNQSKETIGNDFSRSVGTAKFSPDGRFVAFQLDDYSAEKQLNKDSVAVFDLKKGIVAYLNGYNLIGWGIMP